MDGQLAQTLLTGVIVVGAVAYVGRRWIALAAGARKRRDDGGCGGGCCPP